MQPQPARDQRQHPRRDASRVVSYRPNHSSAAVPCLNGAIHLAPAGIKNPLRFRPLAGLCR